MTAALSQESPEEFAQRMIESHNPALEAVFRAASGLAHHMRIEEGYRKELVRAMRDAYGPHTMEQIARAAGISRQRVQQLLKED